MLNLQSVYSKTVEAIKEKVSEQRQLTEIKVELLHEM